MRIPYLLTMTVLVVAAGGCNLGSKIGNGISDFGNNLADPDLITVGGPGVRVAEGHFASPLVDPWDENPVVVAFEFKDDGPHLAMLPLKDGTKCNTGVAYSSIVRDKLDNLTQLIAYSSGGDGDDYGSVHFVDHQCKEYGTPIEHAKLPVHLYEDPPGYLVPTRTQLLLVAPWTQKTTVIAEHLAWFGDWNEDDGSIAVIDGGHFRVFDKKLKRLADIGTNVSQMFHLSGAAFGLLDGGVLRTYQSLSDTAPVEIATDACEPQLDVNGCLFFYSPCGDRALQCYRSTTGTSKQLLEGVRSVVSTRPSTDSGLMAMLYTKDRDAGGVDLWLSITDEEPRMVVSNFNRLFAWSPPDKQIDALVNADNQLGQLLRRVSTVNGVSETILFEQVSETFSQGLLVNVDADQRIGDLYTPVQLDQVPQLVVRGVPNVKGGGAILESTNVNTVQYGKAVITNAKDRIGDLTLIRYPATAAGPASPRVIASQVPVGKYQFFKYMNAIVYTSNWNTSTGKGELNLHQLDIDAVTTISEEVNEFLEITWPWEGVVYLIPDGDRAGIWVARAK